MNYLRPSNGLHRPFSQREWQNGEKLKAVSIPNGLHRPFSLQCWKWYMVQSFCFNPEREGRNN